MPEPATFEKVHRAEVAFQSFLRTKGLKLTRSRREILLAVMTQSNHFQAEELLLEMRQGGRQVAKATIYRTLPLLAEAGIIKRVRLGPDMIHYEHCYGEPPHDHLICENCGEVTEFESSEVIRLLEGIARRHSFEPLSHRVQIVGMCRRCTAKAGGS
jgi:Fur family ferric uptake transcriptional regulator